MPKQIIEVGFVNGEKKQFIYDEETKKVTGYSSAHSYEDIEYNQKHNVRGEERFPPLEHPQSEVYQRIQRAETGGLEDPWIRNKVLGSGSSAFGEVQITKGLIEGVLKDPKKYNLDEQDISFLGWMRDQGNLMLKYGGKDMKPGFERYDYGQKADFTEEHIPKYRKAVGKILDSMYDSYIKAGGTKQDFWRQWRFGEIDAKDIKKQDARYEKVYNQ